MLWLLVPVTHDLSQVLPALTAFVDSARSGLLPNATLSAFPWLPPSSGLADPVPGGFYSDASYVKFSLPLATSMTMLAWSLVRAARAAHACMYACAARALRLQC